MISQCSVCNKPYSTKDFAEAKKRVCRACAKIKPVETVNAVKPADSPKSNGMAVAFIPKPDDRFNQRPLVWAK